MNTIAFDCETWLIRPGLLAPRLVCGSFASEEQGSVVYDPDSTIATLEWCLPWFRVIGHNIAFDVAVTCAHAPHLVPLWFEAYEAGRVHDTMIRQKLIDLASGDITKGSRFSLAHLTKRHLGIDITESKNDPTAWRLRYHELDCVPLEDWPAEAIDYARDDAIHTLAVYDAQGGHVVNEIEQNRYALALHLASCWGLRTNGGSVAALKAKITAQLGQVDDLLKREGLMRPSGSKNLKALRERVSIAYGGSPPTTEKGAVSTKSDVLLGTTDPVLVALGNASKPKHALSNTIPALEKGTEHPINPRYTPVKNTGRISSSKPNIQNFNRSGGFRECFEARLGQAFLGADYQQIEMCALAQACLDLLGWSSMAEAIRAGKDLHLVMAALMLGQPYETLDKDTHAEPRQRAKAANFGFPGGLGAAAFCEYARGYGLELTEDEARSIRADWLAAWPEMPMYFRYISKLVGEARADVIQLRSGRVRGQCYYTQACNTYFQGLAADGMGRATWLVARDCYNDPKSPLWGWRTIAVVHDELLLEGPRDCDLDAAAGRLCELMIEGMAQYIPDVPIRVDPAVSLVWSKNAKAVRDSQGRLVPWMP